MSCVRAPHQSSSDSPPKLYFVGEHAVVEVSAAEGEAAGHAVVELLQFFEVRCGVLSTASGSCCTHTAESQDGNDLAAGLQVLCRVFFAADSHPEWGYDNLLFNSEEGPRAVFRHMEVSNLGLHRHASSGTDLDSCASRCCFPTRYWLCHSPAWSVTLLSRILGNVSTPTRHPRSQATARRISSTASELQRSRRRTDGKTRLWQ